MADGFNHPLDLVFPAFMDGDFKPGIALRLTDLRYFRRRRKPIFQLDTSLQGLNLGIVEDALDLDQVGFGNVVARMEQRLREISVIGQQHEPFTVEIQPPDGKDPNRYPV